MRWYRARRLTALLAALFFVAPTHAITDEDIFRNFQFNFINPGGRSLAMGGAFISLADDATAAQANPAGLTTLLSPQIFFEARFADPEFASTEIGLENAMMEPIAIEVETEPELVVSPSFVSYVRPWNRFAFGVSRQELLNVQNQPEASYEFESVAGVDTRESLGDIDLLLVNWNASLAVKIHENFRLGLTATYGVFDLSSRITNFYTDETAAGDLIGSPDLAGVPFAMYKTEIDTKDADVTLTAGFLWKIGKRLSLGGVYRQGGDFEFDEELTVFPIAPTTLPGMIASRVFLNESGSLPTGNDDSFVSSNEFHVPDVLGAGISWRPIVELTLALDANRISYSDILEGFNSRLNLLTVDFDEEADARFAVDDQTNIHFGAEYVYRRPNKATTLIFRAGFRQDKDNQLRADFPSNAPLGNETFTGRGDENHWSIGLGIVSGNNFQIDFAFDRAGESTEGVASLIYKF